MRIVYKYALIPPGIESQEIPSPPYIATVMMPAESTVLHADIQNGNIVVWALVESKVPSAQQKYFLVMPTGIEIPQEYHFSEYVGTIRDGEYVWHVFDCTYAYNKSAVES